MSYTWGYVKDASLAKLDLTEEEADTQNLLSRFPFYANEVITQICSSIKPKYTFAEFEITKELVGKPVDMPKDFVGFGDDICYQLKEDPMCVYYNNTKLIKVPLHDDDFEYNGYNQVVFNKPGKFYISYNARWVTFDKNFTNETVIPAPDDVVDCIPSYIASQCYKIDDDYKASVYRNEYEIMLSRIDNTNYKNTKTFIIGGDW